MERGRDGVFRKRVNALEAFGHRGSATGNEEKAAVYLAGEIAGMGLMPEIETFRGYDSLGARMLLHVILAAAGLAFLPFEPLAASAFALFAMSSFIVEMHTRAHLLSRILPARVSCNVFARVPAAGDAENYAPQIILCAHMDSQRTGIMWGGMLAGNLAPLWEKLPRLVKSPIFPVLLAFSLQILLGALVRFAPGSVLVPPIGGYILFAYIAGLILLAEWGRGKFVPGANDNATGCAALFEIADRWLREPVAGVELVLLFSGCEETGCVGAGAWAQGHLDELRRRGSACVAVDTLGAGAPRFLGGEHSLAGIPVSHSQGLAAVCARIAMEMGLEKAGPHASPVGTDALPFIARGVPAVTITSFGERMRIPGYHQMSDTSDNIDYAVALKTTGFVWKVVEEIAREMRQNEERSKRLQAR